MKKLIYIFIAFIAYSFTSAQEYPLNYEGNTPDGAYYKDLNGELDKYVGVWKGTWNGKTIYLDLRKVKYYYDGSYPYYKDEILGERKIVRSNGLIEINRITNFDYEHPEFVGVYSMPGNINPNKSFSFYPKDMCGKYGTLEITDFNEVQKTMTLHFEYYPSFDIPNCQHDAYVAQYGDYPINFPKDIVLQKQP